MDNRLEATSNAHCSSNTPARRKANEKKKYNKHLNKTEPVWGRGVSVFLSD